jgi:hypothetical protein
MLFCFVRLNTVFLIHYGHTDILLCWEIYSHLRKVFRKVAVYSLAIIFSYSSFTMTFLIFRPILPYPPSVCNPNFLAQMPHPNLGQPYPKWHLNKGVYIIFALFSLFLSFSLSLFLTGNKWVWFLEQCQMWEYSATFLRWVYSTYFLSILFW